MAQFLRNFKRIPSRMRIMHWNGSMQQILPFVVDKDTAVAFDFDQTITLTRQGAKGKEFSVRGGADTVAALRQMKAQGVPMCIITAQATTLKVVHSMADEIRKLELDDVFDVESFAPGPVLDLVKTWGSNYTMSLDKLTRKLIMLIAINSERYPKDLARISYKRTRFFDAVTELSRSYNDKLVLEKKAYLLKLEQQACAAKEAEEKRLEEEAAAQFLKDNAHLDEDKLRQAKRKRKEELLLANDAKAKAESPEWEVDFRLPIDPKAPILIAPSDIPSRCVYSIAVLTPDGKMPEIGQEQWSNQTMRAVGRRTPALQSRLNFSVDANGKLQSKLELGEADDLKDTENYHKDPSKFCPSMPLDPTMEAHLQTKYAHVIHETNPLLCPVRCWLAFMIRTFAFRSASNPVDRLLIDCSNASEGVVAPALTIPQIEQLVKQTLQEAKVNPQKWESLLQERGQLFETKGCKVAMLGNTFASLRNKPECFEFFLERNGHRPKRLIFVDDNSDNAFNMFMYFARPQVDKMLAYDKLHDNDGKAEQEAEEDSAEKQLTPEQKLEKFGGGPSVVSFWFQPARVVEQADPMILTMLQALVKASGGVIPDPPPKE